MVVMMMVMMVVMMDMIGHPGAVRSAGPRRRGKGIVEQCCVKGCDLQYLEHYCARPKRERRHMRHTPPPPAPHTEDQSWLMFLRRYETNQFENEPEKFMERLKERMLYQRKSGRASLLPPIRRKIPKSSQRLKHRRKRRN
ncbi:hypothetical protein AMELA_G00266000 [Ameiurus melas]|uniref:Insulin-like domain-containing protein n=1 Tax=Ameiurus melas TaxID=219545 RepID=A0A7J5ZQF6_AMEME|nr:hypothetical protein AMELA_G00266000 [Ameiurus melas]